MAKKDKAHVSETPATQMLKAHKVAFTEHPYEYVEHGGTAESARQLGLDEHCVIKTLVMQDQDAKPLIVLMHGDCTVSTKNLARQIGAKSVEPCKPEVANRHSGYLVDFPMEQERVASVILHDAQGHAIPVGSQVRRASRSAAVVGYDGIAWLENLSDVNALEVTTPAGKRCRVTLTVGANPEHKLQTFGPLICREGT